MLKGRVTNLEAFMGIVCWYHRVDRGGDDKVDGWSVCCLLPPRLDSAGAGRRVRC